MIEEIWRPIEGYEGLYEVSNTGRVRSVDRYVKTCYGSYRLYKGKVLSLVITSYGYFVVSLHFNGKQNTIKVHRIVAQAFIPNPDNLPEVNHKDEVKTNNNVDNLEWCDSKYNNSYGSKIERQKKTNIQNGLWTGLSKKEYCKNWYKENREKILMQKKENRRKKKEMIQNNA